MRNLQTNILTKYINEIEEKENQSVTHIIAYHSFLNPIIINDINKKRILNNKCIISFSVFVHGTGLKMYLNELRGDNITEFPFRFTPLARKENALNKAKNCFIISKSEHIKIMQVFPNLATSIVFSANGINQNMFFPQQKQLCYNQLLNTLTSKHYSGTEKPIPLYTYDKIVINVGRFANWKRLDCLLRAASCYEKELENKVLTIVVGTGPIEQQKLYMDLASELKLKDTFFVGPQPQNILAQLYSIASIGVFPSFEEPMGMVLVECMACGTPVISANSGGPKDFVNKNVGGLVKETLTLEEDHTSFCNDLSDMIMVSLNEDWKTHKSSECIKIVQNNYSTISQAQNILKCCI